jgi:hypothetical protein
MPLPMTRKSTYLLPPLAYPCNAAPLVAPEAAAFRPPDLMSAPPTLLFVDVVVSGKSSTAAVDGVILRRGRRREDKFKQTARRHGAPAASAPRAPMPAAAAAAEVGLRDVEATVEAREGEGRTVLWPNRYWGAPEAAAIVAVEGNSARSPECQTMQLSNRYRGRDGSCAASQTRALSSGAVKKGTSMWPNFLLTRISQFDTCHQTCSSCHALRATALAIKLGAGEKQRAI